MTTTFVTSFFLLEKYNPEKSIEKYFGHFRQLVETGINLAVYISPELENVLREIEKKYVNVKILGVLDIKDTWVYKTCKRDGIKLPANRNMQKDTLDYMICQNEKLESVQDAINKNPFNTEVFAWIDLGIYHVFKDPDAASNMLKKISSRTLKPGSLVFGGCWNQGYDYLSGVNWRYAGGHFIGTKDQLLDMWKCYQEFLPKFLDQHNTMLWEVNIWAAMESEIGWSPSWFAADHNNTIINVPDEYFM